MCLIVFHVSLFELCTHAGVSPKLHENSFGNFKANSNVYYTPKYILTRIASLYYGHKFSMQVPRKHECYTLNSVPNPKNYEYKCLDEYAIQIP